MKGGAKLKPYAKWLHAFMESWKNLEGAKTCEMFASPCEYYENPIDPPTIAKTAIQKLWAVVPQNQKDITYNGEILFENAESCIYHFSMQRTMIATDKIQRIDGVFEIKLDEKELLTYFKQWRFTKEV